MSPSTKSIKSNRTETVWLILPPDGGWGWAVVLGAFFSYFVSDGLLYSYGIFLKDISRTLKCSESKVSLAGAVNTCMFCFSGPFSAALVNKYGYRFVSISGSIIASISCLLTSFSININMVIAIHGVLGGIGFGMIYITAIIVVGFYFEKWRALATGIAVCGAGIGGMVLPPVITILLNKVGWRYAFCVLSAMTLTITLFALLFKPIRPTRIVVMRESTPQTQRNNNSFFSKYSNSGYGKLVDDKISLVTVLEPSKFNKKSSTEIVVTNYPQSSPNTSYKAVTSIFDDEENDKEPKREVIEIEEGNEGDNRRCRCCPKNCCKLKRFRYNDRPIYRDDIFFTGSVKTLPEYKLSQMTRMPPDSSTINKYIFQRINFEYQLSVTRTSTHEEQEEKKFKCCPIAVKRTIATMLDFRLLKSVNFILLVFNGAFISLGFYTPYIFVKDSAIEHGSDKETAFWLISTMGFTNTLGRISCGILCSIPNVKAIVLAYVLLFIGGISTILSTISYEHWALYLYCAVYGFTLSSMSALRTLIIVDMLGLDKLTNAIGMIMMFQGFGTFTGITLSGFLRDVTGDYKYSFYFGGTCISIAATFLFAIHMKNIKQPPLS